MKGWLHYGGENVKKVRCPREKQIRADIVFNSWISALSLEPIPPQMWWEKYETHPVKDEDIPSEGEKDEDENRRWEFDC